MYQVLTIFQALCHLLFTVTIETITVSCFPDEKIRVYKRFRELGLITSTVDTDKIPALSNRWICPHHEYILSWGKKKFREAITLESEATNFPVWFLSEIVQLAHFTGEEIEAQRS